MIKILTSDPLTDKDAFWNTVDPVSMDTLISLYGKEEKQSWTYNGNDVIFLPEMPVGDVLEFMQIHKLFKNIPDSFHKTHLHIFGDRFGFVTQALNPYRVTYLDDVDSKYASDVASKDYVLKEEEIVNKVVVLNDHVETLYEIDIDFKEAYMLTREANILTLFALDYMLKGLASTIDADYYFNTTKIITCEPYTLIKVERAEVPCLKI